VLALGKVVHELNWRGRMTCACSDMSVRKNSPREVKARRWAARLMESVRAVLSMRPEADPDNIRHTLILLEKPPLERLRRSLTRGRALAQRK
jgi:hypothetical protein